MRIPETATGKFEPGDPVTGKPGSRLSSAYMNSDLNEKLNILGAAGIAQSNDDDGQLLAAIRKLIATATDGVLLPVRGGTGLDWAPPGNYLVGNGTAAMTSKTPGQVLRDIGGAPLESPALTGAPTAPTPAADDSGARIATTAFVAGNFPRIYSIGALPNQNVGPIIVAECAEVWLWCASQYFTGYRSPLCGRPLDGHTGLALINEVDANGGLLSKADYAPLWGYAQETGLVKPEAVWSANRGAHWFSDYSATHFRAPDLRNRFRRFTGTDVDTMTVRAPYTTQADALQRITGYVDGTFDFVESSGAFTRGNWNPDRQMNTGIRASGNHRFDFDSARVTRHSCETRPINTAYHPRLHA